MTATDLAHKTEDMATGHARLKVGGMTCSACVGHVEKALMKVPGVTGATVNLGTEQADVDFGKGVGVADLARAIEDAGYDVVADEVTLSVTGMTCSACVGHVERALKKVPGVLEASVNLATESARVSSTGVSAADLVKVIEDAGYGASVADEGAPDDERAAAADRREMLVVLAAALLSLPLVLPCSIGFSISSKASILVFLSEDAASSIVPPMSGALRNSSSTVGIRPASAC